jgi:hypothetical protein
MDAKPDNVLYGCVLTEQFLKRYGYTVKTIGNVPIVTRSFPRVSLRPGPLVACLLFPSALTSLTPDEDVLIDNSIPSSSAAPPRLQFIPPYVRKCYCLQLWWTGHQYSLGRSTSLHWLTSL